MANVQEKNTNVKDAGKTVQAASNPQELIDLFADFYLPNTDYENRYGKQSGLVNGYLRIGDTILPVPPNNIVITEQNDIATIPLLRQSTATTLMNGKVDKTVMITMYFKSVNDICGMEKSVPFSHKMNYNPNSEKPFTKYIDAPHCNSLRALVAQFKRTPILPVENKDLFEHNIDALALMQLDIETVPNFPNVLKVTIVAIPYDYSNCLIGPQTFFNWIVWPVWRWHWRNDYLRYFEGDVYYENYDPQSLVGKMASDVTFSIASDLELDQRKTIYERKDHITPEMYPLTEGELTLDEVNITGMIVTGMRISMSNQFSVLKATGKEEPFIQFMGGSNAEISISATLSSGNGLTPVGETQLNALYEDVRKIVRDHHYMIMSGFFKLNNPLLNMLNIDYVVPKEKQIATVPQYPSIRSVEMSFMSFDTKQKAREQLENLTHFLNKQYKKAASDDMAKKVELLSNNAMSSICFYMPGVAYRAGAYQLKESTSKYLSSYADGPFADAGFIQSAHEAMSMMELYPDLKLPEYESFLYAVPGICEDYARNKMKSDGVNLFNCGYATDLLKDVEAGLRNNNYDSIHHQTASLTQAGPRVSNYGKFTLDFEMMQTGGRFVDPDFYVIKPPMHPLGYALYLTVRDKRKRFLVDKATSASIGTIRLPSNYNDHKNAEWIKYDLSCQMYEPSSADMYIDTPGKDFMDSVVGMNDDYINLKFEISQLAEKKLFGTNNDFSSIAKENADTEGNYKCALEAPMGSTIITDATSAKDLRKEFISAIKKKCKCKSEVEATKLYDDFQIENTTGCDPLSLCPAIWQAVLADKFNCDVNNPEAKTFFSYFKRYLNTMANLRDKNHTNVDNTFKAVATFIDENIIGKQGYVENNAYNYCGVIYSYYWAEMAMKYNAEHAQDEVKFDPLISIVTYLPEVSEDPDQVVKWPDIPADVKKNIFTFAVLLHQYTRIQQNEKVRDSKNNADQIKKLISTGTIDEKYIVEGNKKYTQEQVKAKTKSLNAVYASNKGFDQNIDFDRLVIASLKYYHDNRPDQTLEWGALHYVNCHTGLLMSRFLKDTDMVSKACDYDENFSKIYNEINRDSNERKLLDETMYKIEERLNTDPSTYSNATPYLGVLGTPKVTKLYAAFCEQNLSTRIMELMAVKAMIVGKDLYKSQINNAVIDALSVNKIDLNRLTEYCDGMEIMCGYAWDRDKFLKIYKDISVEWKPEVARQIYKDMEDDLKTSIEGDTWEQELMKEYRKAAINEVPAGTMNVDETVRQSSPYDSETAFEKFWGHYADMVEQDNYGRISSSYPAYCILLIDESQPFWGVRLQPIFSSVASAISIKVNRNHERPADVCEIEFSNAYQCLSSYAFDQYMANNSYRETWLTYWKLMVPNYFTGYKEKIKSKIFSERSKEHHSIMLRPGTRLHVRLGYSGNALKMPIAFNGSISDVRYTSEYTMSVEAQGDGMELAKKIPIDEEMASLKPDITGWEPRQLITHMLMSCGGSEGTDVFGQNTRQQMWNWMKKMLNAQTHNFLFRENPLGITHFGNPLYFSLWDYTSNKDANAGLAADFQYGYRNFIDYYKKNTGEAITDTIGAVALALPVLAVGGMVVPALMSGLISFVSTSIAFIDSGAAVAAALKLALPALIGSAAVTAVYAERSARSAIYNAIDSNDVMLALKFATNPMAIPCLAIEQTQKAVGSILGGIASNIIYGYFRWDYSGYKSAGETGENVYSTTCYEKPRTRMSVELGSLHMPSFGLDMYIYDKTPWDLIRLCADSKPNFVAAVRPFEFRSTLFFGQPYYSMRHSYKRISLADIMANKKLLNNYGMPIFYLCKPFSQLHVIDSTRNLISEEISASESKMYNQVIMRWFTEPDSDQINPKNIDSETQYISKLIYPERRKTAIVDSNYVGTKLARGAVFEKLNWLLSLGGGVLCPNKLEPVKWLGKIIDSVFSHYFWNHAHARLIARSILRDYAREMYQGEVKSLGDATVWPHDKVYLHNDYGDKHGMSLVRNNNIIFSPHTGYINATELMPYIYVKGDQKIMDNASVHSIVIGETMASLVYQKTVNYLTRVGTRELIKHSLNAFKVMPRLSEYYTRQTFFEACKALNGWLEGNSDNIIVKGISNFVNVTEQRQVYEQLIKEYGFRDKLTIDKSIGTLLEDFNLVKKGGTLEVAKVDMDSIKASWEIIKDKNVFGSQEIYADFVTNYRERVLALAKEEMPKAAEGFIANRVKNVQVQELFIKLAKKDPHKMMAIFDKARALHGDVVGMIAKRGVGEEAEELAFKEFSTIFKEILGNPKAEAELIKGMVGTLEKTSSIVQALYGIMSVGPFTLLGTTVMPGFGTIIGKIADEILYFALLSVPMTYFERYFDDQYALEMSLLSYRGQEFSAGINGHGLNNVCFKMNTPDDLDIFNTYEAMKKKFLKNDKAKDLSEMLFTDTRKGISMAFTSVNNSYIVAAARQRLGYTYDMYNRYGSHSVDCSSFVYLTFKDLGVKLPELADTQCAFTDGNHGFVKLQVVLSKPATLKKIKETLQPGDIIFFEYTYDGAYVALRETGIPVSHVGIYTGGGNKIHASSGAGCVVESPMSEWDEQHFFMAKRYVGGKQ